MEAQTQITAIALMGKTCTINLEPRGRQMRKSYGPGSVSTWCEPEHRVEMGRALEDCKTLGKQLTKAGLRGAILQLNPNACGIMGSKDSLETYLATMLIELWFPYCDA